MMQETASPNRELAVPKKRKEKENRFLSGVFVLSLSAVIVKIIGLVYKIPMLKLLGSEGMGYFNSAYELYTLFCVIATAGLPVAASVMISGALSSKKGNAEKIFRVSLQAFLILGLLGTAILFGFAKPFAAFLGSERALYCIYAIAPTVFFICLVSAYRGYFQGFGRMMPTALSQIIEALGKLILGLLFAFLALDSRLPTETVAAFAVLGLTLGTAVSALCLVLIKFRTKKPRLLKEETDGKILPKLLKTAIPVTLSSAVISLTKVIDMTMILRRMQSIGYSNEESFAAYGNYTTLALPLFGLAPALITSVALPLIPTLSGAIASGNREAEKASIMDAVKLTCLIAMPISAGLTLFAEPILSLLFQGEGEAIAMSAPLLSMLGVSVTLSCLITVSNAILQAYSKASLPILSMAIGSGLKLLLAFVLIGNPKLGIMGAPVSTFFCDLVINAVNFYCISKYAPDLGGLLKSLVRLFWASAVAVASARLIYGVLVSYYSASAMITLVCIGLAALLYLPLMLLFGAFEKEELSKIPVLKKLIRNHAI